MTDSSLLHVKGSTWLVPGPTNIGIVEDTDGVWLIDSGNDKESGRRLLKILNEREWHLKGIINTHSNADHIGANSYLQNQTGCEIWASEAEAAFIRTPILESSFLWGGFPYKELRNKFFEAKASNVTHIIAHNERSEPFTFLPLPGHYFGMTGVMSDDGVFFLGDALCGTHVLEKYKIAYIYDVKAFKESLKKIAETKADWYVPSHGEMTEKIGDLIDLNLNRAGEIESCILRIISDNKIFDDILKEICGHFGITLDYAQYVLIGNTVRSFLSYLHNEGRAHFCFDDNRMVWRRD